MWKARRAHRKGTSSEEEGLFTYLPNETLVLIFSFLDARDLARSECVSSKWLAALRGNPVLQQRKREGRWPRAGGVFAVKHKKSKLFPVLTFGTEGSDDGQFNGAWGVAVARNDDIIVSDCKNHRIQIFSSEGVFIRKWGKWSGDDKFTWPMYVTVNSMGNIIFGATLESGDGIAVYENDGTLVKLIDLKREVQGITVDARDNIIVSLSSLRRMSSSGTVDLPSCIQIFSKDWTVVHQFELKDGSDEEKPFTPGGVAVDRDGNILVIDASHNCVQRFTMDGTWLSKFGKDIGRERNMWGGGSWSVARGIAVDGSGNILVADNCSSQIHIFSGDGKLLQQIGKSGQKENRLVSPEAVAVDSNGRIIVIDRVCSRVQVFSHAKKSGK
jgi:tripartite motif-containing protein 71